MPKNNPKHLQIKVGKIYVRKKSTDCIKSLTKPFYFLLINVSYFPMVSGSATNLDEFKTARAESPIPNRAVRKGCYSVDA